MRWPVSRRKAAKHARTPDAVIMSVTQPLTRRTARELVRAVERVDRAAPIVIDLTAIPGFDTDGAEALLALQASHGADRVSIVGLRQATARLVGPEEPAPVATVPANGGGGAPPPRHPGVGQTPDAPPPTPADPRGAGGGAADR